MQAGRLIISKGSGAPGEGSQAPRAEPRSASPVQPPAAAAPSAGPAPDFNLVHHRLAALERLSLLRDKGALSAEEFAAEKALVLRLPAEELWLAPEAAIPTRGPSLLGRLFSLKMLVAGAAAGVCLSAITAPQDLLSLIDRAAVLIG